MTSGWFRDTPRDADDLCPNCCTPWKCNGPHLNENEVVELRAEALGAIRRAAAHARWYDAKRAEALAHCGDYKRLVEMARASKSDDLDHLDYMWQVYSEDADVLLHSAIAARATIRAAIGSEKA